MITINTEGQEPWSCLILREEGSERQIDVIEMVYPYALGNQLPCSIDGVSTIVEVVEIGTLVMLPNKDAMGRQSEYAALQIFVKRLSDR